MNRLQGEIGEDMARVTGVMIYYYFVCQRKLWYFDKKIMMEHTSELVGIGKLIDETAYSREKHSILIDEIINIDFLRQWKIIHEVKKSKKMDQAGRWQLLYYMSVLKEKGVLIEKGVLDYPKLKQREEVYLTKEAEDELRKAKIHIQQITERPTPPKPLKQTCCKSCAYYVLCYI